VEKRNATYQMNPKTRRSGVISGKLFGPFVVSAQAD
jgi:hypothetical protein